MEERNVAIPFWLRPRLLTSLVHAPRRSPIPPSKPSILARKMSSKAPQFGFEISDKISGEVNRLDVWSVMSPASGQSSRSFARLR